MPLTDVTVIEILSPACKGILRAGHSLWHLSWVAPVPGLGSIFSLEPETFILPVDLLFSFLLDLRAIIALSLSQSHRKVLFKLLYFSKFLKWICQNWYMDFSRLLHGFFKIDTWISLICHMEFRKFDTWISLNCYMDLSNLLYGFLKVVSWICQSCFICSRPRPLANET